jgi:elongation factor G
VSVFDGKMHPVDSNDVSFKIAGMMAFRQAFREADPLLLEPISHVEVLCPHELTGHVIGDLQSRRAILDGIFTEGHFQRISAKVPLAEMEGYSSSLRSITQGRARFSMEFFDYGPVPHELQRKPTEIYHADAITLEP